MERVAFLIEPNGPRLACLLNPEGLTVRRSSGVLTRRALGGLVSGRGLSDDPLHFTGGGATELELDLMFDVDLISAPSPPTDVRDLTSALWRLAENLNPEGTFAPPPVVRFIWGKSWNIPAVVTAVAERFDRFSSDGAPRRSWMRMRLVRAQEESTSVPPLTPPGSWPVASDPIDSAPAAEEEGLVHAVIGAGEEEVGGDRLDELAHRYYGDVSAWRLLALVNDITDPLSLPAGALLRVPGEGGGAP